MEKINNLKKAFTLLEVMITITVAWVYILAVSYMIDYSYFQNSYNINLIRKSNEITVIDGWKKVRLMNNKVVDNIITRPDIWQRYVTWIDWKTYLNYNWVLLDKTDWKLVDILFY